jgi:F-type H+-transporting ATPase subunit a
MEHGFTWHTLLPEGLQHLIGDHTFFAIVTALLLILLAIKARAALSSANDPIVPPGELGSRNIAELIVQLIVSQSDAIIGKQGRKYVPYFGTFFIFILFGNLIGLLPGFSSPTGNLNTTLGLAICSFIGYNFIGVREQGMGYFKHFIGPMTTLPAKSLLGKLALLPV